MSKDTLTLKNAIELIRASHTNPTIRLDKKLILSIIKKTLNTQTQRTVWGWKEPNTQIFIDHISEYFPTLKYIHVVRHGLDMAFSDNKQQLFNWGYKYGISLDGQEKEDEIAYKQLSYWVHSTKEAISKAQRLRENFLLINHSNFCIAPKKHVDQIIQFVDIKISPNN